MTRMIVGRFKPKAERFCLGTSASVSNLHPLVAGIRWTEASCLRCSCKLWHGKLWTWCNVQTWMQIGWHNKSCKRFMQWTITNSGNSVWYDLAESGQSYMPAHSRHKFIHQITLNPYSTCRPCTTQCSLTGFRILVIKMNDNVHSFDFYLKSIKSLILTTKEQVIRQAKWLRACWTRSPGPKLS